jgi:hypothetical protein
MKRLLLITGPQGSGNHLFSKLFAIHPDVFGWKSLNKTYWIGHDQEPFNQFWVDPSRWAHADFGDYRYAVASISVPYVQNGTTVIPDIDQFISYARQTGWTTQIAVIGRDINILEHQQTRLRKRVTYPDMLDKLEKTIDHYDPFYLSHELVYLYRKKYLKSIGNFLNFPVDYDNPLIDDILCKNSNKKYFHPVEKVELDQLVIQGMASTANPGTEWYNENYTNVNIEKGEINGS